MTSQIDICNRALSAIGTRSSIASLTEGSAEATLCALHYDNTRTSVLRTHTWSFAKRQTALALIGAASGTPENPLGAGILSIDPWLYYYAYPVNCLRVRSIYNPVYAGSGAKVPVIPYEIASTLDAAQNDIKIIMTNQPQVVLIYTTDIVNPDLWDQTFADAMVASLASDLAIPLTGDKSIATAMSQSAVQTIAAAAVLDANESTKPIQHTPDWVSVRGYIVPSGEDFI